MDSELLKRIESIEAQQKLLNTQLAHFNQKLFENGFQTDVKTMREFLLFAQEVDWDKAMQTIEDVEVLVYGSDRLRIPPMIDQVRELYQLYDRAKWAIGTLGVTNAGMIVIGILNLVGRGIP
jgi:hypothetical protein